MSKKKSLFAKATEGAITAKPMASRAPDPMNNRLQAIGESQKAVRTNTRRVEPEECRIWERHNRNFERLDENSCRDLIDSFISQGVQEVPAIVRTTGSKSSPKYEIICGARRFWTVIWLQENHYPNFKYLIEIRDLDDEQAFRLANIENLDRQDISDYERALDYKLALREYYGGKQKDMADRLRKSEGWLSKHLKLAELPAEIPNAYASWVDLKLYHSVELAKVLTAKLSAQKVLRRAKELHAQHAADRKVGNKPMPGSAVLKALKDAAQTIKVKQGGPIAEYGAGEFAAVVSIKSKNQAGINVHVSTKTAASAKEVLSAFEKALGDHYR